MKPLLILLLAIFFLFQSSCKDDDSVSSSTCIFMMDQSGSPIGTYGDCEDVDQWKEIELTEEECGYLDFGNVLTGADSGPVNIERLRVFPNPVPTDSPLFMIIDANEDKIVTVKFTVIAKDKNIYSQVRYLTPTNYAEEVIFTEDFSSYYQGGEYYEIYVKVFVEGDQDEIFSSHGTILYCDSPNIANVDTDCF